MATLTKTTLDATVEADQSKHQKIINNSGVDISVCLSLNPGETENSGAILSYNKDFVLLKTPLGNTVIKAGTSDMVMLDVTRINRSTNQPEYNLGYDLLITSPTWLSPIATIGVIQKEDDTGNGFYDAVTITPDDITAMKQAIAFCQTIAAYPDSALARDYAAVLNSNANTNIDNAVASFFAATVSYQKVTMEGIVAFEDYCNRFPFIWAGFAPSTTYYLYGSGGTTFQGSFSLSTSGDVDISKQNGGYTCTFALAVNPADPTKTDVDASKSKSLYFTDGVFVDDPTSDLPAIALKGTFQAKRTFTKNPNDTMIITVISGPVHGQMAIGFN